MIEYRCDYIYFGDKKPLASFVSENYKIIKRYKEHERVTASDIIKYGIGVNKEQGDKGKRLRIYRLFPYFNEYKLVVAVYRLA